MNLDTLMAGIEHFGYAALFLALWLGIVGMPIPDEVIVMTGGAVTANGTLHSMPAFWLTYLGVISGLTLGYALGRFVGPPILNRLRLKRRLNKYIELSERWMDKYGSFALCISYFFPIVRHVMPYVAGSHRMSCKKYALISYGTGLLWVSIFFILGRFFAANLQTAGELVYNYGIWGLMLVLLFLAAFTIRRRFKMSKKTHGGDSL